MGASLTILRPFGEEDGGEDEVVQFVDRSTDFVLETQDPLTGGLAKWVDNSTDPLHTYLGLGGLALAGWPELRPFNPAINVTERSVPRRRGSSGGAK